MSSLRPLATIALLGAVGVYLYMLINDSEPKLSPELEDWSNSSLEVGGDAELVGAARPAALPATTAAPGDAPPFASATLSPAEPAGDAAPPWTPGPLAVAGAAGIAAAADADSSPTARTAETPALPAMPPLPSGGNPEGAPVAAGTAGSIVGDGADAALASTTADPPATEGPPPTDAAPPAATQASLFAAARVAVQGALDRGELAQALLLLSDWYGDPSLTRAESQEVNGLLSQLAGSVIYEGPPAHRLLPAHIVQSGETLDAIAAKYDVPWQLLAKINGIADPAALVAGQELKVVQGPFSALIDLSERRLTLMLDRRYAGQFPLDIEPTASVEEGQWKVDQKLLTPASGSIYGAAGAAAEDRSLLLANVANPAGPATVLRGPGVADPVSAEPRGRVLRLASSDVQDVYDILSVGSRVTIRR